jgi:branched-subunit amino acid ABC-type transport system permease component
MEQSSFYKRLSPVSRAVFGAIFGGLGAALGTLYARPLVGAFHDSAPWVLPAIVGAVLSALVLLVLLVPLIFKGRAPK